MSNAPKVMFLFILMLLLASPAVLAKEDNRGKESKEMKEGKAGVVTAVVGKEIAGQVSGISKDYIGVIYQGEKNIEYEMGIYIEGTPELERVKDLAEIGAGDTVRVQYDKVSEIGEDGKGVARHVAKKIIFVKKAPSPAAEDNTLISDEGGQ